MKRLLFTCIITSTLISGTAQAFNLNLNKLGKLVSSTKEVLTFDEEKQRELGEGYAARLIGSSGLVNAPEAQRYLNEVGQWLALQLDDPHQWHFAVLDSNDVNAFSTISGHVFLTKGLVNLLETEDQLAAVVAHEMIHVLNEHHLDAIKNQNNKSFAQSLTSFAADNKGDEGEMLSQAINSGTEVWVKGLDKDYEFEADQWGAVLAARGGYDPFAMIEVLLLLEQRDPKDNALKLMLATHPSPRQRMEASMAIIESFDPSERSSQTTPMFARFKQGIGSAN